MSRSFSGQPYQPPPKLSLRADFSRIQYYNLPSAKLLRKKSPLATDAPLLDGQIVIFLLPSGDRFEGEEFRLVIWGEVE